MQICDLDSTGSGQCPISSYLGTSHSYTTTILTRIFLHADDQLHLLKHYRHYFIYSLKVLIIKSERTSTINITQNNLF